jgi:periplasmic copper chaperone A
MIRTLSLAAVAATFAMPALACEGFSVHDPYARASTMMSVSGAAFMVMRNEGPADCHVTGVHSDASQRTELHTHIQDDNGVMRMVHVEEGFIVPAGGELHLRRGAEHVMFLGLTDPMEQGDIVTVTFEFEDGSEYSTQIPVDLERMPGQGMQHGQMQGQMQGN